MAKTQAAAVMKAADKARSAQRRVDDCKRALANAERARDRTDAHYLELVSASVGSRSQAPAPFVLVCSLMTGCQSIRTITAAESGAIQPTYVGGVA